LINQIDNYGTNNSTSNVANNNSSLSNFINYNQSEPNANVDSGNSLSTLNTNTYQSTQMEYFQPAVHHQAQSHLYPYHSAYYNQAQQLNQFNSSNANGLGRNANLNRSNSASNVNDNLVYEIKFENIIDDEQQPLTNRNSHLINNNHNDLDDDDDDDVDEEEEEENEEDEEFEDEELTSENSSNNYLMNSSNNGNNNSVGKKYSNKKKMISKESHDQQCEDGTYMNSLFNSPSSLSSSSNSAHLTDLNIINNNNQTSLTTSSSTTGTPANTTINSKKMSSQYAKLKNQTDTQSSSKENKMNERKRKNGFKMSMKSFKKGFYDNNQYMIGANGFKILSEEELANDKRQFYATAYEHISKPSQQMIENYNLAGIMNDYDLVNLPLRELNKRLRFLPKQVAYSMKKRRRTLKNRKYAQNCRSKRLEQKSEMEIQNCQLKIEITRLNKLIEKLQNENSFLKIQFSNNLGSIEMGDDTNKKMNSSFSSSINSSQNKNSSSNTKPNLNGANTNHHLAQMNLPLTPSTPTHISTTNPLTTTVSNSANANSQLSHLLSMPPIKASNEVLNNYTNNSMHVLSK
jgi:hypothetical protein